MPAAIAWAAGGSVDGSNRPGFRFGLIDRALAPVAGHPAVAQLRTDLVAVVSAEALFSLTDLAGLDPDDAVASLVRTARTITRCFIDA